MKNRKIVLLIDAENTSARYAKRIVNYLEKRGDIICARIYGDFINNISVKGWNSVAIEYEMEQKQQLTTSSGKNSSDIALVIDAMDLLYQKNIDTLCIVTSDGDFTGLVKRIREDGIEVIGIGKTDASKRLEKVCDQYLDFEELAEEQNIGKKLTIDSGNVKKITDKKEKKTEKSSKTVGDKTERNSETEGKNKKDSKAKTENKTKSNGKNKLEQKEKNLSGYVSEQKEKKASVKLQNRKNDKKSKQKNDKVYDKKNLKKQNKKTSNVIAVDREKLGDVKTAIHEIIQQEEKKGKKAELGGIKSQLQLRIPDFNERDLGYRSMRDFIIRETKFDVQTEGHHTYVVPERKEWDKRGIPRNYEKRAKENEKISSNFNETLKKSEEMPMNNLEHDKQSEEILIAPVENNRTPESKKRFGFSFGAFKKRNKE